MSAQVHSPFFSKLSPELRNLVYKYAFLHDEPVDIDEPKHPLVDT